MDVESHSAFHDQKGALQRSSRHHIDDVDDDGSSPVIMHVYTYSMANYAFVYRLCQLRSESKPRSGHSVHALLVINHSDIVKSRTVFLDKGLVSRVFGNVVIPVLTRCEFDYEAMCEATLERSVHRDYTDSRRNIMAFEKLT